MEWEKKFNSILNDTKANLSRVKTKYEPSSSMKNVTWAPNYNSTPMKRSMSISEIPPLSPSLYPVSSLNNSIHMTEFQPGASQLMQYPSSQTLLEKIELQNNAIDHLRGLIHRMETDRHNYKEQIRDLRNEVYQLTERAGDRRTDPGLERRMEQIRREMLGEVQLLQSQLQITSAKGSNLQVSDTQLLSMNRDVLEIKHAFRDELEGSRRDIEILRSRITKLELELAGTMSGRREVERRQDNMDRTLCSLTTTQTKPQIPSSALAMMNTNRQLEKLQINTLRATLSSLQGKIDMLEQSQPLTSSSKISPSSKPVFSNGFSAQFKPDNDLIDDIDLSDGGSSESSDFTEFEQDMPKDKMSRPLRKQTHIIEEEVDTDDLDMDDLDLSDDFSQNSLSDPLENEDLS
ncbi:uncharacterized protein LOC128213262 [Mya arenaria]|uniref:uncharacterized protein LOC128213262 n=1 Tax=Mya arenaria TaxID=6604 RepID=UPI0022E1774B|nr:uncharacterized protein LOC128213262 [Mya arenaria]